MTGMLVIDMTTLGLAQSQKFSPGNSGAMSRFFSRPVSGWCEKPRDMRHEA